MINFKDKKYFVLGTSTDIGKTYFVENICKKLKRQNISINAIKPIISGFDFNDKNSDSYKIIKSLELEFNQKNLDEISPFRLKNPFSPLKAAKMENKMLNFNKIVDFCTLKINESSKNKTGLIIERAGGVMTPINEEYTYLDLAEKLNIEIILIGAVFLGAISQILCAVEALKSRNIKINSIIINKNNFDETDLDYNDIADEVENFSKIKCYKMNQIIADNF